MGRKVSDRFAVPICRLHHRELHRRGNERAWWQNQGIDPLPIAASFWTGRTRSHLPPRRLWGTEIGQPGSAQRSMDVLLATEPPPALIGIQMTKRSQFVARRPDELVA
jgi:hypothetical protein